jgi:hypothetical protein
VALELRLPAVVQMGPTKRPWLLGTRGSFASSKSQLSSCSNSNNVE